MTPDTQSQRKRLTRTLASSVLRRHSCPASGLNPSISTQSRVSCGYFEMRHCVNLRRFASYVARGTKDSEVELVQSLRKTACPLKQGEILLEVAKLRHRAQTYSEAMEAYKQSLALISPMPSSKETLFLQATILHGQAVVLVEQKQLDEALDKAESALEMRKTLLGSEHPAVAEALTTIGTVLLRQGRVTRATECFEEALHGFLAHSKGKEDDAFVTLAFFNLGMAYLRNDALKSHGQVALDKSLQLAEIVWGVGHPQTEAMRQAVGSGTPNAQSEVGRV